MSNIYGLFDKDGNLRYIGKANDPAHRLRCHVRDTISGRRNYPVNNWIGKNGTPQLRILEANCADWRESEKRLIAEARARGDRLLNVADGGEQPHVTLEQRMKNGAATGPKNIRAMHRHLDDNPEKAVARELMVRLGQFLRSIKSGGAYSKEWLDKSKERARLIHKLRPDLFPKIVAMYDELPEPVA